jgi:hypothetical protein
MLVPKKREEFRPQNKISTTLAQPLWVHVILPAPVVDLTQSKANILLAENHVRCDRVKDSQLTGQYRGFRKTETHNLDA